MDIKSIERIGKEDFSRGLLLKRGIIVHYGEIYNTEVPEFSKAFDVIRWLMETDEFDSENLTIRIESSPGGSAEASLAIYDSIRKFADETGLSIRTEVYGGAYSSACMILLQAGDHRIASKNSIFLLHEIRKFTFMREDTKSDIEDTKKHMEMITDKIYSIIATKCGKSVEEVDKVIDRKEVHMDAEEALEWGLIDEII
jgi:ATP-dependent protease ClpP protease subunit